MRKLELLSPAGSLEICKGVIDAGADAVYLGGNLFGARAYAKNFDQEQLFEALDYAHLHGKKIFLTVNTLVKNAEMEKYLYDYMEPLYRHGLDAAIVQDLGVTSFLHNHFPELPLHGSTQMSGTSAYGAREMQQLGISRIVTAREVSLQEISSIYQETGMEIESFVHGALCYCYSGQCLLSSLLGGRSGNRGRCAQPCRLSYQVTNAKGDIYNRKQPYPISPKDLCTLDLLPLMAEAGVFSYKIEGRMKQLEYAVGVTEIYRKYMDILESGETYQHAEKKDIDALLSLGNRNGFTEGYYKKRNDKSVLSLTTSAHRSGKNGENAFTEESSGKGNERYSKKADKSNLKKASSDLQKNIDKERLTEEKVNLSKNVERISTSKIPVSAHVQLITGQPAMIELSTGNHDSTIVYNGTEVMQAQKQPLQYQDVCDRLKKTGNTPFDLKDIKLELSEDAFLPVKLLNELRREALERLTEKLLDSYKRELPANGQRPKSVSTEWTAHSKEAAVIFQSQTLDNNSKQIQTDWKLSVLVRNSQQLAEVLKYSAVEAVYLDDDSLRSDWKKMQVAVQHIHTAGKQAVYAFPFILRKDREDAFIEHLPAFLDCAFDGVLIRSIDTLGFVKETLPEKLPVIADHSLYSFSDQAVQTLETEGCNLVTAPFELNEKEFRHRGNEHTEMILYGWIPVMHTAQCIYKNFDVCRKKQSKEETLFLQDRYFKKFLIAQHCPDCYNTIYNSQPLYLFGHADKIQKLGFASIRLEFLAESVKEVRQILSDYTAIYENGQPADLKKWENRYTNGHFKRGVE